MRRFGQTCGRLRRFEPLCKVELVSRGRMNLNGPLKWRITTEKTMKEWKLWQRLSSHNLTGDIEHRKTSARDRKKSSKWLLRGDKTIERKWRKHDSRTISALPLVHHHSSHPPFIHLPVLFTSPFFWQLLGGWGGDGGMMEG